MRALRVLRSTESHRRGYYGNPWQTDGLNNQQIGGASAYVGDIKDRSQHSGTINSIDLYRKTGAGYSLGTGGSWTVRCESDDGSGSPSGSLIAAGATVTAATSATDLIQNFAFGTPIVDVAGMLRHFRVTNADGLPAVNFVSLNCQDLSNLNPTPLQPTYADDNRALLTSTGGAFTIDRSRYPIFCLNYADGSHYGESYYDAISGSGQREIGSGGRMVRFNITPSANVTLTGAHARVYKVTGTAAALTLNMRNLTAVTLLDTTSIAAASVNLGNTGTGYGARYVNWTFASPITLTSGTNYSLELASTEVTNPYVSFPSRRGGGAGFAVNLVGADRFLDGYWEYSTNGTVWNTHSPGTTEQQMQAYFDVR